MHVWLIQIGEPLPLNQGANDRLFRTGLLSRILAQAGHSVTWWASTFDHLRKEHRFNTTTEIQGKDRVRLVLMHGCRYRSNVSFARMRNHSQIAAQFAALSKKDDQKPDVIVCGWPTVKLGEEAVKYGRENRVPVVLDMRDMWPDVFLSPFPRFVRPLAHLFFKPLFHKAQKVSSQASAITGITEAFVEWGLKKAGRPARALDQSFPFGYPAVSPSPPVIEEAERFWKQRGVSRNGGSFILAFVGTFGRLFDFTTLIKGAALLEKRGVPVKFILCGSGDYLEHYKRLASGLMSVEFPGFINSGQIYVLLRSSSIGLNPLIDRYDTQATINNKAIEYLSAGLPILSCPNRGVLADLITRESCGATYAMGDVAGMANIITELRANPQKLKNMSINCNSLFHDKFEANGVYQRMMEYLAEVVRAGPISA
jgi:glycosyltransferase involved in cell wall biosynthesis